MAGGEFFIDRYNQFRKGSECQCDPFNKAANVKKTIGCDCPYIAPEAQKQKGIRFLGFKIPF